MRYRAIRPVKTAKTVWIFLALLIPCASSSQVKPLPPPPARAPSPAFPVKPVPPAAAAPSPAMPEELESARGTGPSQTYAQSLMPLQEPEQYRSLMSGPMALRGAAAATVLDKAFALYQEAEFEKAVSELEKIIAEMQKRQQKIREAVATDFLGLVYQRQGSLLAAMRRHRDAIDLLAREQVSAALEPRVNAMNNLAVAYYFRGEYQEAESWLAKAIDEASASPQTKARALNNRGLIRQELGNPREALADFDEAEGSAGADPVLRAQVLNNLARLRGSQGRMDDAVAKLKEAQRLAREAGDAILEANILDSWGEVLLKADRPREALQKLSEADALERKAQAPLIRVAISWNMGRALAKLGQRDNARASYDTAVKLARQFSLAALHREALASRGDLYLQSGKLDEAIEDYKNAVELAQNIRGALRGQTEKEFAQAAQRVYENLVRALIRRGKSGDVELALNYLDQSKSDMLRRELLKVNPELQDKIAERSIQGARGLLDKEAALSALLQQELLRKGPKGRIDRIRRELEETRRDYLAALDELNQKYGSRYTEYAGISPLTFGQSASWLAPGQLLVIFLPTEDGLYYFLVSKESGVEFRQNLSKGAGRKALYENIRAYRDLIVGVSGRRSDWAIRSWTDPKWDPLRRRTTQLYETILQPIADRLRAANQIIFVPTGLLYYLPLHALGPFDPRVKEIRFLIQEKPVSYLTNATLLTVVGEARPIRPALLALGNPPFQHDKPKLTPLDRAEEEVEALSKLFGGRSLVLKGPDATKENLLAMLGASGPKARSELLAKRGAALPAGEGFGFVHLATHGILEPDRPRESWLALDGTKKLEAREIQRLDLSGVSLVTLSACQTALAEENPGADLMSLATFINAGAKVPSTVVSLWEVDDLATRDLMVRFYEVLLKQKPVHKARALQEAQRSLASKPETRHPFFWSAFILIGDWR